MNQGLGLQEPARAERRRDGTSLRRLLRAYRVTFRRGQESAIPARLAPDSYEDYGVLNM